MVVVVAFLASSADAAAGWYYGALRHSACGFRILISDQIVSGQYVPLAHVDVEPTTSACRTLTVQLIYNNGGSRSCGTLSPASIGRRLGCNSTSLANARAGICYVYVRGVDSTGLLRDINFAFWTKTWF